MKSSRKLSKLKISLSVLAVSAAIRGYASDSKTGPAETFDQIKGGLSAEKFREYGKTSPTAVNTRVGTLEVNEGGFAGGYPTGFKPMPGKVGSLTCDSTARRKQFSTSLIRFAGRQAGQVSPRQGEIPA